MVDKWTDKYSIEDKKLSHQFRIISLLLFPIPTIVFLYVVSGMTSFSDIMQAKYIIPYLFSIIIILCVLALLQSLFSQVSAISSVMMRGSEHLLEELKEIKGAHELRGIADSFGALLERYQMAGNDLQRRAVELLLVKEFAEEVSVSLDINRLLSHLLDKAMQVNKAGIGSVFLIDKDGENFHVVSSRGPRSNVIAGAIISIKDSIVHHVMDAGTGPLLVDDIETDIRFRKKNDPQYTSPSFLSLPIRSGGKLIAVLNLADKAEGEHFRQGDVDLVTIMVQAVGFALENARAHSELKQQAEYLMQKTDALKEEVRLRKQAEKELKNLALKDPLTGLPNRYMFIDRLEVAVARAERNNKKLAVMFVDLDRFKHINDTLGHAAGDITLREVSERMTGCLRKTDLIARYGGDEFTFILADMDETEGVGNVASKIRDVFRQPIKLNGTEFNVGCSLGISIYPDDSDNIDGLIQHADAAMYASKRANGDHD
ncbi:MAG: sensor domain-containing diguanylate cyclase [Mariprofundaceae bacterium]|nr:sensor domain-containing diguanylate cyclase [Mariprofundaceae bacterium]